MKRKHFILAFVAMLMCVSFSAYAGDVIVVNSWAELKAALEANDGVQRSAARQRSTAMRTVSTASESTTEAVTKTPIPKTPYYYEDFQTTMIQLGKDVVYDDALPISKSSGTTLDLNGHTVSGSESAEHSYPFYNYGMFLVVDNSEAGTGAIFCGVQTGIKDDGVSINEEAVFVMTGGNIICTHDSEDDAAVVNYGIAYITGGTIEGANNAVLNKDGATMNVLNGALITGDVVGTGIEAGSGVYAVAQIGTAKYGTLQAAIDAVKEGETVQLLAGTIEESTITLPATLKNVTIQGAEDAVLKNTLVTTPALGNTSYDGVTFNGVAFDNSRIYLPGWASDALNQSVSVKNLAITNCTFENIVATSNIAAVNLNMAQSELVENFTFTGNTINSITGGESSGVIALVKGDVTITGNTIKNVSGNAINVQFADAEVTITRNTLENWGTSGAGRAIRSVVIDANNASLTATENVMIHTDAPEEFAKVTGTDVAKVVNLNGNYWSGNNPIAEGILSVENEIVDSYYADAALNTLLHNKVGGSIVGYTDTNRIWGEAWGNASYSFVVKVYGKDGTEIGSTSLKESTGLIDGDVSVSWQIKLDDTSSSWDMVWVEGAPSIKNMPAKVELWIDGEKVSEGEIRLNSPDNLTTYNAAVIDTDGKILSYQPTLADAVAAGNNVAILTAGTYQVPTGKNLTITGAVDGVLFDNIGACNMGGANVTFNNVTFDYYPNVNYTGLQHSGNLVYNNCTINGQVFLYGQSETFNKCTFNQNSADAYNVWTYGAKEVAFNECIFNSAGKSVLVYNEGACATTLTVENTKFNADAAVEGKAAIEIDTSLMPGQTTITVDGETTATGFGFGNVSGNSLWNNKKGNADAANNDITVTVDGKTVLAPVYEAKVTAADGTETNHRTFAGAFKAVNAGETITIFAGEYTGGLDVKKAITVEGETDTEGNNLVNFTGKLNITADGATVKNINFNNGSDTAAYINAKDVTVDGCQVVGGNGFRYCYTKGTVTFKNSVITGDVYGIHFDGNEGGNIVIDNCTITGWTSFAKTINKVAMSNTEFAEGNYNYVRFYQKEVEISECNFNEKMNIDLAVNEAKATVENCTVKNKAVEDLFSGEDIANSTITVDGVKLVRIAKVGDVYYETITEAINAAADDATVEILAGEHSEYIAPWAGNSKHDTEKSITIVGAADYATTLTGGMYLGYDDSQCREHNIVVKGIVFQGKGLKVACQQNVTIEGNKFTNITEGQAIAVIGKDINSIVKNNVIESVSAAQGIELRNTLTAVVEGNTISGTGHNSLQITSQVGATASTATVKNNTLTDWGLKGEGRAMRINGIVTATINGNVMTHSTTAPEEFVKVTSATTLDASQNYWAGVTPLTAGMLNTDMTADPASLLKSYYTDATKSNLIAISASPVMIGNTYYQSLADALAAAQDGETVTLLWNEGDPAIAMNGSVYGKNVTITGTATVDWSKGWFFVGRGGEGNGTVTFEDANLTAVKSSGDHGIHVSGREKNTTNKYDGTVVIKNSTIELDYLINKGAMTLDNSILTVKYGTAIGGRPASETESGEDATATMTLNKGSKLVVNNHNGMGLGYEAIGVMNIDATSTFETTQAFLVTAKGTMNIAGTVEIAGALTNNGAINFTTTTATLATTTEGLTISHNQGESYKVVYENGVYRLAHYVAYIGDVYYETLEAALKALTDGATLTLLENITVTEAWDCRNNGAQVTAANVTIDGNGHTLKLTGEVNDANWNTVFRLEGDNATVKNLTIDASEATGIQRGITAKLSITVDNCTFIGNGNTAKLAVIFGEGAGDGIADVVATVTKSTFRNWSYGVSDNQNGQDAKSVTVSGNTFENASVLVSASKNVTFVGNELTGAGVNITSYTNMSGLSVSAVENVLDAEQENKITVDPSHIYAQGGFSTPIVKVGEPVKYYVTLGEAIEEANGATVTVLDDIILSEAVVVDSVAAVLNLNGNSITPAADATMTGGLIRLLDNADLTITGEGEISNNGNEKVYAAVGVLGNDAKLTVNGGNLIGYYYGIAGNGYKTGTQVTINGGVIAGNSTDGLGIYHPQNGTLTVTGGEITGATGIYFKGGKLDIQGGTIKGTGAAVDYVYQGSGCEATGDALVIENAAANGYAAIESVSITGGTFISENAAPVASYAPEASDALVEFIGEGCNAQFSNDNIDENLLVIGYQLTMAEGAEFYGVELTNHREAMTIVDGAYTEFVNETELSVGTLTYERTLPAAGNWYPLYVPFEIPVEALTSLGYEAAFFYDVHFEVLAGGEINPASAPEVHIIKIKQGTLKANFPYVIRASKDADLNLSLVLENTTLFTTAESAMNSVESGSTINRFIFAGTYKSANPKELIGDANVPCYAVTNDGGFAKLPESVYLSPFRVHMSIIAKDGSPVILDDVVAESIKMRAIGEENEDGTTTIYDVEADEQTVDYIYDLQGRRVLEPQKGSLYIVNGKKIVF